VAEETKIEWCDSTMNPWIGCTKIAPACDHCYAADMAKRYGWVEWGNAPRKRTSDALWRNPIKWQREAAAFFADHGRRRRVFCASLADVFDNQVPPEWRADLWALIHATPDLDWLLLTKRPQNIAGMKPEFWDEVRGHVWLGTTVEDQKHAAANIPHLLDHDCAVRFISAEPLLGPLAIENHLLDYPIEGRAGRLNWVIAGGESGPHARPSNPAWFTSLRDQCAAAGVPFLFKQWGEWAPHRPTAGGDLGGDIRRGKVTTVHPTGESDVDVFERTGRNTIPGTRYVARLGKKQAGRALDGVTHDGFPAAA
jgi:protein gp37